MGEWSLTLARRMMPLGVGTATGHLVEECKNLVIHVPHSLMARWRYRHASGLSIHLGCGPNRKTGWVNVDLQKGSDVRLDLRRSLPFPDGSSAFVYSEHFFEHVDYPVRAGFLLDECHRVLRPGGTFSVVVPDMEMVLRAFVLGGSPEYYEAQKRWHPDWCQTQMEYVNFNFRQDGEHRFCYDFETLSRLLERHGFVDVRKRPFDPALDSAERLVGSLYVDAKRP